MNVSYLLPKSFKVLGVILLLPGLVIGLATLAGYEPDWATVQVPAFFPNDFSLTSDNGEKGTWLFEFESNNILNEISLILLLVGSVFILFARQKLEDEMILKLRLESMLWGVRSGVVLTLIATVCLYSFSFFYYMIAAMFLPLWLASIHFHWSIYKLSHS